MKMARLRVRLVVNPGRRGAPLSKLGKIAEQAEKFLQSLAADCDVETKLGEWLAVEFENSSVAYDAEFQGAVDSGAASVFARNLEILADYEAEQEGSNLAIQPKTALEYAKIGSFIDPDEVIKLGIYPAHGGNPKWRAITYSKTAAIKREIESPLPSYGAVQGIVHSWAKEARDPHFHLRELSTEALVRVYYGPSLYGDVAKAVQQRTTMLIVSGDMLFDRASRNATELRADRIAPVGLLSTSEFEGFFGSAPEFQPDDFSIDA